MLKKKKKLTVSALIPVFNEEKTVEIIVKKIISLKYVSEIIIVDDASTDNTAEILKKFKSKKIHLITHPKNSGKTAAIQTALKKSTGDIIVVQDADLEYDPDELIDVIDPIQNGLADVVYGSRFLVKKATRVLYYYHFIANKFLTVLSNLLTNLNMTDIETCYKAFRRPIVEDFPFSSSGFGMEVEITAMISKMNVRIYEVPISYYGRTYEDGKKIGMKDGIYAIYYILFYNLFGRLSKKRRKYLEAVKKKLS